MTPVVLFAGLGHARRKPRPLERAFGRAGARDRLGGMLRRALPRQCVPSQGLCGTWHALPLKSCKPLRRHGLGQAERVPRGAPVPGPSGCPPKAVG
jgi:hypothetical protein